jgi:hypothetical protein
MKKKGGFITIDFLFAIVISFGMILALFSMCLSLTMIEVTQYIAFATSRAYVPSMKTEVQQQDAAVKKYAELSNHPVLKPLYNGGWFKIPPPQKIQAKDYGSLYGNNKSNFIGVRLPLGVPMLYKFFKIPFIGSGFDNEEDLEMTLTSYLTRESSFTECKEFFEMRRGKIKTLDPRFNKVDETRYIIMEDNGC